MKSNNINTFLILCCFYLFLIENTGAQQTSFTETPEVRYAIERYKHKNEASEKRSGWRIQFLYTQNRRELESKFQQIKQRFPEHKVYWEQKTPFYIVKGCAFETELEARRFVFEIAEDYPDALPRREMVSREELLASMN